MSEITFTAYLTKQNKTKKKNKKKSAEKIRQNLQDLENSVFSFK